jgi:hypothetical protein
MHSATWRSLVTLAMVERMQQRMAEETLETMYVHSELWEVCLERDGCWKAGAVRRGFRVCFCSCNGGKMTACFYADGKRNE